MSWVDEKFNRVDLHGCVCRDGMDREECSWAHCSIGKHKRPAQWSAMVRLAKRLGAAVGMHMRIDLFSSPKGVVLGEFTPLHSDGKMHCDLRPLQPSASTTPTTQGQPSSTKVVGAIRRRNGNSGQVDLVDACRLGRLWLESGHDEGSDGQPMRVKQPNILRGWPLLMYNEAAKCKVALRMMPVGRSRTLHQPKG